MLLYFVIEPIKPNDKYIRYKSFSISHICIAFQLWVLSPLCYNHRSNLMNKIPIRINLEKWHSETTEWNISVPICMQPAHFSTELHIIQASRETTYNTSHSTLDIGFMRTLWMKYLIIVAPFSLGYQGSFVSERFV